MNVDVDSEPAVLLHTPTRFTVHTQTKRTLSIMSVVLKLRLSHMSDCLRKEISERLAREAR